MLPAETDYNRFHHTSFQTREKTRLPLRYNSFSDSAVLRKNLFSLFDCSFILIYVCTYEIM